MSITPQLPETIQRNSPLGQLSLGIPKIVGVVQSVDVAPLEEHPTSVQQFVQSALITGLNKKIKVKLTNNNSCL